MIRKVEITVVGWLLLFLSIICSFGIFGLLPYYGIWKIILTLLTLVIFFIIGKDILNLKVYARKVALNYLVPVLVLLMPLLLMLRVKVDSASFYASMGKLPRPTSMDVISPTFSFGVIICGISIISGLFILFILTRSNIKEQFK